MSERKPLVAANWKMHKTRAETTAFLDAFLPLARERLDGVELVLCPPFTSLQAAVEGCAGTEVGVAAQNLHFERQGAFTGEVSAPMLAELGVDGVILGHSERRQLFGETDEALRRKVPAALGEGLTPILCVGETIAEREAGETEDVLRRQLEADLADVAEADLARMEIAYEPVWAIGTGKNATVDQATAAIAYIRSLVAARGASAAESIRILYGGSVKPANAAELLGPGEIDGALVGGASLSPGDFFEIALAAAASSSATPGAAA
jgi:triosephosphate isomerase